MHTKAHVFRISPNLILLLLLVGAINMLGCIFASQPIKPKPVLEKLLGTPLPHSLKIVRHKTVKGGIGSSVAAFIVVLNGHDLNVLLAKSGAKHYRRKQMMEQFDNALTAWFPEVFREDKKAVWEYDSVYQIQTILKPPSNTRYSRVPKSVESYLVVDKLKNNRYRIFIYASPFLLDERL